MWGRLAPDRALLQRAYSLDAVAEELLFVSGPLLVGVLVGFAPPALGIVVGTVLMVAGSAGFVASPVVRDVRPGDAKERPRGGRGRRVLRGLGRPVIAAAGVGPVLGVIGLLVVAFAEGHGYGGDSAAWVLAALSAGSAVGGLRNGAVAWRSPAAARLPLQAAGLGLALLGAGLASGLGTLMAAVATVDAGGTAGAAVAGVLVGWLPTGVCFAVTGGVTLLRAVAVARGARRGRGTAVAVPLA